MKLNLDCMRDILLEMEKLELNHRLSFRDLSRKLPSYSQDVLQYNCAKLYEAHLADATAVNLNGLSTPYIADLVDITFAGHQFLEKVRDDERFSKTKSIASALRDYSLSAICSIAEGVSSAAISAYFSNASPS